MKKIFHIDEALFQEAKATCGARADTETVRLGLQALVRRTAYERLRAFSGTELHVCDVPRRREKATAKRKMT